MFYESLAQVTGTILGLLLAVVATLYSVSSRRADSDLQEQRQKLRELDGQYSAVLRELSEITHRGQFETQELRDSSEWDFEGKSNRENAIDILTSEFATGHSKQEIRQWANDQPDSALAQVEAHRARIYELLTRFRNRHSELLNPDEIEKLVESSRVLSQLDSNHRETLYYELTGESPPENHSSEPIFSSKNYFDEWISLNRGQIESRWLKTDWTEDTLEGKTLLSLSILFRELEADSVDLLKSIPWNRPNQRLRRIIGISSIAAVFGIVGPMLILLISVYDSTILQNGRIAASLGGVMFLLTLTSIVLLLKETHRFIRLSLPR